MKSLYARTLDITDYLVNNEFDKVASIMEVLPDAAKKVDLPTESIGDENDYAVVLWNGKEQLKKYAMNTPEFTQINTALFLINKNSLPDELVKIAGTNLAAAHKRYNLTLPDELEEYESDKFVNRILNVNKINEAEYILKTAKKESADFKNYALNGKYPIDTEVQLIKAAEWLDRNHSKLSLDEIFEFSSNLKKRSSEMDFNLTKLSGYTGYINDLDKSKFNPDFYNLIQVRKNYIKEDDEESFELYDDLIRRADELGVEKTAYLLDVVDKECGLDRLYGKFITDPIVTTFAKTAELDSNSLVFEGVKITSEDLKKLAEKSELTQILGNDGLSELKSKDNLVIFDSFPSPIKKELINHLNK